ncbi:MAG: hypothetical protein WCC60_06080, partial [Ilumatobacteraceae bacterium]
SPEELGVLVDSVAQRVRRAAALALELGDAGMDPGTELDRDPRVASYQLTSLAPIGPADRYDLLCAPGPADRLHALDALLEDVEATQLFRLQNP